MGRTVDIFFTPVYVDSTENGKIIREQITSLGGHENSLRPEGFTGKIWENSRASASAGRGKLYVPILTSHKTNASECSYLAVRHLDVGGRWVLVSEALPLSTAEHSLAIHLLWLHDGIIEHLERLLRDTGYKGWMNNEFRLVFICMYFLNSSIIFSIHCVCVSRFGIR